MQKLIINRQNAVAYALSPFILALLCLAVVALTPDQPFEAQNLLTDMPSLWVPVVMMLCGLPALYVLLGWCVRRFFGGRPVGAQWLLLALMLPLVWIPAGFLGIPFYVANLFCLATRRYPEGSPFPWKNALLCALCMAGVIIVLSTLQTAQPMPTAAEAYQLHQPKAAIIAEVVLAEDATLVIAHNGAGEFVRGADGWTLRAAYRTRVQVLTDTAATLVTCRNPADGPDVVIISRMQMNDQPACRVSDTNGAAFTEIAEPLGRATHYTWYALTDADAPGYSVSFE